MKPAQAYAKPGLHRFFKGKLAIQKRNREPMQPLQGKTEKSIFCRRDWLNANFYKHAFSRAEVA
jgi:hypothetical protein